MFQLPDMTWLFYFAVVGIVVAAIVAIGLVGGLGYILYTGAATLLA